MNPKPCKKYPLYKTKRLSGRRKAVTVCIAAACEHSHFVVAACDMMLSTPTMKVEGAIAKIKKLGRWTAQIFSIHEERFHEHSIDGFAAIGSGSEPASTSLMFQGYGSHLRLARVIGQVCIAKFMAEYSDGVGKVTLIAVLGVDLDNHFLMQPYEVERIRDFWTAAGQPRYPEGMDDIVWEMIKEKMPGLY